MLVSCSVREQGYFVVSQTHGSLLGFCKGKCDHHHYDFYWHCLCVVLIMMFCRMGQFVFILHSFLDSVLKKHLPRENSEFVNKG